MSFNLIIPCGLPQGENKYISLSKLDTLRLAAGRFIPKSYRITAMEKAEIKQIADYLKDLEEGLYEWDYRGITTQGQLTELYRIIKRLMDATFETKDQELKVLLATLEYKARKCKECIERRTGVRN